MEICIDKINRLRSLYEDEQYIASLKKSLTRPLIRDEKLVYQIYNYITEGGKHPFNKVYDREKFIYVIAYIFSPSALIGRKMKNGIRKMLADCLGVKTENAISNNLNQAIFDYNTYADFRNETNELFAKIMNAAHLFY